jgi:AcrR family transcriptional regulator
MSVINTLPINRLERRRLHTREQLIAAAVELLEEIGYPALSIKSITDRADLGYGTFYLHFTDKDDIVWAIMLAAVEEQRQWVDSQVKDIPFPHREYRSWVLLFEYAATTRQWISRLFGKQGSAKLLQRYQEYLATMHETNLRNGVYSAGLDLPPDFLAQYITGALVRLLIWWSETPNDYTAQQMAQMLYEAVYRQRPPP